MIRLAGRLAVTVPVAVAMALCAGATVPSLAQGLPLAAVAPQSRPGDRQSAPLVRLRDIALKAE